MIFLFVTMLVVIIARAEENNNNNTLRFPADFKIGVSTSSYQIEGAWNVSDKGVNVWDHFTHKKPSPIFDGSNGDIACDSYHKYKEDVAIMKNLGVDFYRFSISWSRILPTGFANKVSKDGIQYYKNLLNELKNHGIEPLVTLYHWDHPQILEEMGGWTNEMMVTWFVDYATIVFRELGDMIKIYATINEPAVYCVQSYGNGYLAPGKTIPGHGPYLCIHNVLKAHAKVYKIYNTDFRSIQGGKIGIAISCTSYKAKYQNDTETPDIQHWFDCGWLAHPIYSKHGDYAAVMKERIAENSKMEGYPTSRLPKFTQAEIDDIRGSADYFGLNHYTSKLTEPAPKSNDTLWYNDSGVIATYNSTTKKSGSPIYRIVPKGFGDILRKLKKLYDNPPIYVLENGVDDGSRTLEDFQRIQFFHDYLRELLIAINRDACNVKRYTIWSLLDNFEWNMGYINKFGLVNVDFQDPSRPRTPKLSYTWFQELLRSRKLPSINISKREV